jgi:hypothetical protein
LVAAGKYVNDIPAIARQPLITMEKLREVVLSAGSAPKLYSEDPRPGEFGCGIFAGQQRHEHRSWKCLVKTEKT